MKKLLVFLLLLVFSLSTYASSRILSGGSFGQRYGIDPTGLVLWLDQSDPRSYGDVGNWYDLSGNNKHAVQAVGGSQPTLLGMVGLGGSCRFFDGAADNMSFGDDADLEGFTAFTITSWINIDNYGADDGHGKSGIMVNKFWDGATRTYYFAHDSGGLLATRIATADTPAPAVTVKSNDAVAIDTWAQAVLRYDGANIDFFIDGQDAGGGAAETGAVLTNTDEARVGVYAAAVYFDGYIAHIAILNRALSDAEIQRMYLVDKPRYGGL